VFRAGETAVPFLLISPLTEANGMGEASVAISTDDPLAFITNPAQIGMGGHNRSVSFGYNYAEWLPGIVGTDLSYQSFGLNAGANLKDIFTVAPDIDVGVGYSRIFLDLGRYTDTSPTGPEPIGTYRSYETSDQLISVWIIAGTMKYCDRYRLCGQEKLTISW
jgi:hypothetical protein